MEYRKKSQELLSPSGGSLKQKKIFFPLLSAAKNKAGNKTYKQNIQVEIAKTHFLPVLIEKNAS